MNIVVTGASKGIGYQIVKQFSKNASNKIIAISRDEKLLNELYIELNSSDSLKILPFDLTKLLSDNNELINQIKSQFSSVDILINNASALYWNYIENTPIKKYDLINKVNTRGTYLLSQACIPHMPPGSSIITQSLPINSVFMDKYIEPEALNGKTAYLLSKIGMSLVASGLAIELKDKKISSNCIWHNFIPL